MLFIFCGLSQLDNCPVRNGPRRCQVAARNGQPAAWALLSAAERRGTRVLLSASVSDNFGNSPQIAAPRRSREIDQSTQRFYVGWFPCWLARNWGPIRCGDTKCLVSVLPSLVRYQYYYKPGQSLGEGFLTKNLPLGEYLGTTSCVLQVAKK